MSHPLAPGWLVAPRDANALHSGIWPANMRRGSNGELEVGGLSVGELVQRYGTPLFVFDQDDFASRARLVQDALTAACSRHGVSGTVYYASKSFISGHVVSWVEDAGLGFDVATAGEMAIALGGGANPDHIEFQGNNKSEDEIAQAMSAGVATIVIDAPIEAERIQGIASSMDTRQKVMIRVNTGVHADTHDYLATAREDQKFGLSPDEALSLVQVIRDFSHLDFVGLHSHIGSQIFSTEGFLEAATRMVDVYGKAFVEGDPFTLNLGGGFGIAYTESDQPMDLAELMTAIVDHVAALCAKRGLPIPNLAFEPGRVISGPAGVTLYTVGVTKPVTVHEGDSVATRLYVSVDGGMSDNARPALYGAHYSARIASRQSQVAPELVRVVGKHCESGDIVVDAEYLPGDVAPGDILAVAATGAYCHSLASNYNVVGRPPVVAVSGGSSTLMVAGETLDDVLARDQGLSRGQE
ncbi:MAG: diaminopimelate decarboxylase [Pontimonas sp.]